MCSVMADTTYYEGVKSKVSVAIRVRPFIERERDANETEKWTVDKNDLWSNDAEGKNIRWTYDHVFGQETQTTDIYSKVVAPIVVKSFDGFNGTILCYGQTSSGKTHTLYGSEKDKGIISLFAEHLFQQKFLDEGRKMYIVKVGVIEIYNEKLTDLLNSDNSIDIQERDGNFVPTGLEELTVTCSRELIEIAEEAQQRRKTGETAMNKNSSRSHTALRVTISIADLSDEENTHNFTQPRLGNPALTTSVLHFVDLAGSEKQSQTGAEGDRLKEAININKSLSSLSHVINQLSGHAEINDKSLCRASTDPRKGPISRFINFRDSKLTRLLKSTLSGEAYISLVCNVTVANVLETRSTLEFASRAKNIKVQPKQNFSASNEFEKKIVELQTVLETKDKEMERLKRQLEDLTNILPRYQTPFPFLQPPPKTYDQRRYSLCIPSQSSGISRNTFGGMSVQDVSKKPINSRLSDEDDFMSAEKATMHFKQLTKDREIESVSKWRNQEVQTEAQGLITPKRRKTDLSLPETPTSTLLATRSILRAALESDQSEWADKLAFLEEENKSQQVEINILRKENESLNISNQLLINEKTELEKDVLRQIESSRKSLKMLHDELKATKENQPDQLKTNQQITSLEEKIESLRPLEATIMALKEELATATDRIKQLVSEKNDLESDFMRKVEAEKQSYHQQLATLETKYERALAEKSKYEHQIPNLEEKIESLRPLETTNMALKEELATATDRIQQLLSEKNDLESDFLRKVEVEKQSYHQQLATLESQYERALADKSKYEHQIPHLEEKIESLRPLETTNMALKEELTAANDRIQQLVSEKNDLETDFLRKVEVEKQSYHQQLATLETKFEGALSEKSKYEHQIPNLEEKIESLRPLETTNMALKEELATATERIQQLVSEKTVLESDFLRKVEAEKESYHQQLATLESKYEKALAEKSKYEHQIPNLEEKIESLRPLEDTNTALKEELTAAKDRIQQLVSEKTDLESDFLRKVEAEKESYHQQLATLESKYERALAEKSKYEHQIPNLEEKIVSLRPLEDTNTALKEELTAAKDRIQQLVSEKDDLESDFLRKVEAEKQSYHQQFATLETQYERALADKSKYEHQIPHLEEKIESLRPLETTNMALKEELTAATDRIQQLVSEKNDLESDFQRKVEVEKQSFHHQLATLESKYEGALADKSKYEHQILKLEEKIESLRPLEATIMAIKGELTAANGRIQQLVSEKTVLESDFLRKVEVEKQSYHQQLASLESKYERALAEKSKYEHQIPHLEQKIESLRPLEDTNMALNGELTAANDRIQQLVSEKNDLETDFQRKVEAEKQSFHQQLATLETKYKRALAEKSKYEHQIPNLEEKIESLRPLEATVMAIKGELKAANDRIQQLVSEKNDLESDFQRKLETMRSSLNQSSSGAPVKVNRGTDCEIIREEDVKYWKEESRKYRDYARLLHGQNKKKEEQLISLPDKDAKIVELETEVARKEEDIKSLQAIILDVPEPKLLVNEGVQCALLTDPIVKPSSKPVGSVFSKYPVMKPLPPPGFRPPAYLFPHQAKKLLKPNQSENQSSSTQSSSTTDSANITDNDN